MAPLTAFLVWIYLFSAGALALYAAGTLVLLGLWLRYRNQGTPAPPVGDHDWPPVTVQLPVYNERAVVGRLIDAVAALDYPRDRLRVQVLDDSTDDTSALVARRVAYYVRGGLAISHLRRGSRAGYKAGALADGLARTSDGLVAVFDADFVPAPDFLRLVVPHFLADARLGMVQARWGHLNSGESLLTRGQALSLDGHFVVEQTARSRSGLLINFSGSGGVWRTDCVREAGGWSDATLTEDLDLSYRAQLCGWRCLYLPEVVVPGEIPPQLAAYKRQQARWAKGSTQSLLRLGGRLWRSDRLTFWQKMMGTLHLCQYLVHPLMLLLLVLTPPLLGQGVLAGLPLAPLGVLSIGPPLLYLASQRQLYADWPRRILAFPILLTIGTGMALNNTLAVIEAVRGSPNVFRRTPKFRSRAWQQSRYALGADWTPAGEALLALYAVVGGLLALQRAPSLAPFLFIYAWAFGVVALWSVAEGLQVQFRRRQRSAARRWFSV